MLFASLQMHPTYLYFWSFIKWNLSIQKCDLKFTLCIELTYLCALKYGFGNLRLFCEGERSEILRVPQFLDLNFALWYYILISIWNWFCKICNVSLNNLKIHWKLRIKIFHKKYLNHCSSEIHSSETRVRKIIGMSNSLTKKCIQ